MLRLQPLLCFATPARLCILLFLNFAASRATNTATADNVLASIVKSLSGAVDIDSSSDDDSSVTY